MLYYTRRVVRVAMTRTTRFFIDRKASAVDIRWGLHLLGRCLCKRKSLGEVTEYRQGCITPDKHAQKEKAPKGRWNSSISVIVPSLLRSFNGGDAFIQGLHYRLPLPVFCRTYSAPFCCDFSPLRSYWIRFSYLKLAYKLLDYIQQSGTRRDDAYHSLCVCVDDIVSS